MAFERSVAPGVHRVEDALVNFYLVEDDDGTTIVDAGHPRSWGSLRRALAIVGRRPDDVRALVLTHGHFDHVGCARRVAREWGVPVYAAEGERHLARHPWDYDHERSRLRNAIEHPSFVPRFLRMGLAGALLVRGVDTSPIEGTVAGLRVVRCPGHTHDHCALHLPDRDALIAGDALVTFDPYTGRRGPQIVSGAATANRRQALASLDELAATGARHVLTGHGPVWHGGVEAAVDHARVVGAT